MLTFATVDRSDVVSLQTPLVIYNTLSKLQEQRELRKCSTFAMQVRLIR
jgi:hypothetical protein